jgi:hypothetical protein
MRFRLRTLLIAMSLAAIACAAAGWWWRRNKVEQEAVQVLVKHHAGIEFSDRFGGEMPTGLAQSGLEAWIDEKLGREFRSDVRTVHLYDHNKADDPEVVAALRRLPGLRHVVVDCWPGTDEKQITLDQKLKDVDVRIARMVW